MGKRDGCLQRKRLEVMASPFCFRKQTKGFLSIRAEEKTQRRPHGGYSFLTRGEGGEGTDLFSVVINDRTQGNGRSMCQGRFRLDMRKRFFTQRCWTLNRLPREVSRPQPDSVQEETGQRPQTHGVTCGVSCAGTGAGLDDA